LTPAHVYAACSPQAGPSIVLNFDHHRSCRAELPVSSFSFRSRIDVTAFFADRGQPSARIDFILDNRFYSALAGPDRQQFGMRR
jgi:hypothetical protein